AMRELGSPRSFGCGSATLRLCVERLLQGSGSEVIIRRVAVAARAWRVRCIGALALLVTLNVAFNSAAAEGGISNPSTNDLPPRTLPTGPPLRPSVGWVQ